MDATPTYSTLTLVAGANQNDFSAVISGANASGPLITDSAGDIYWGTLPPVGGALTPYMNCLNGCVSDGWNGATFLEATFSTPVGAVSVLEYQNLDNPAGFQAFNAQGQLIGACFPQGAACASQTGTFMNGEPGTMFTFTSSSDDISTILATSYDGARTQIGAVNGMALDESDPAIMAMIGCLGLMAMFTGSARRRLRRGRTGACPS